MSDEPDLDAIERRMNGAVENLKHEFAGLRTGRASPNLLDPITVEVYGAQMAINQVASISVPESRMLSVSVWDRGSVSAVEKAIRNSGLGVNPVVDGTLIRIPIPELNQERRQEMVKLASKYTEQARVAVRNVRRDGMDQLKKLEKDSKISEDDHKIYADEVQDMTDKAIAVIDAALASKEKEILQV
ncbi:ribosome recycling factor [Zavarzinia compransoris]|uniref:Ribosome-recycling factor n=2 Tax=Zavarzinia compransoris TaxID=1264899 RepID=A0A317E9P8_9PROT|nr:ribosome recycling factor [Zavarzinia compransoris]TDP48074.1 ribosome recycling factor [Zavarzinia compransoris]